MLEMTMYFIAKKDFHSTFNATDHPKFIMFLLSVKFCLAYFKHRIALLVVK